ncbi:hypothetical protein Zmor_012209 [Zophobas morio]|jgi:non-canonical poly(A) RNA polymerase PAPD5/7|uniref:Polynucleotide adenylyltransferase n=2 Tax=Zophobas morio TaxID=2755281 RepID=A0AA38HI59_9CUCU|nr:hypothetical protein Zmor_012209 [Zophobas morio]
MELSKVQVIPKARVPIVKITDALTKVEVDISFNMDSGPSTAALIQKHVADFPVLLPLTFVVKHFLVQRSLNEVYTGGLNSYGIISMIISFLQLHPRIDTPKSLDDVNLGVLLIEFFELYGKNFNYEVVGISLLNGGSYFNKWVASWDKSPFSIRDPLDEANDVTCRSSNMKRIRIAFAHAYAVLVSKLLNRGLHPSLTTLSSIVNIHPEAILARRNALYNWLQRGKTLSRPEDIEQLRLPVRLLLQTSIPAEDGHLPAPDEVKAGGSDTEEVDELTIAGNEYTESGTLSEDSDENIDDDGYTDINYQEVDGSGNAAAQNSP